MIMNIRDCKIMSTEMVLQRVDRAPGIIHRCLDQVDGSFFNTYSMLALCRSRASTSRFSYSMYAHYTIR